MIAIDTNVLVRLLETERSLLNTYLRGYDENLAAVQVGVPGMINGAIQGFRG